MVAGTSTAIHGHEYLRPCSIFGSLSPQLVQGLVADAASVLLTVEGGGGDGGDPGDGGLAEGDAWGWVEGQLGQVIVC